MSARLPISVFIIALNEADRIGAAIRSVSSWVSEVIVIDSGSTDGTQGIATQLGARVLHHDWRGYGLQKRFGEEQCAHEWLLNIDADEEITPELAQEIKDLFAVGEPPLTGYKLPVRDMLPGETTLSRFAHTNTVLRLYDKTKARFSDSPVHDSVIVRVGEVTSLQHPVLHRSFRNLSHMIEKMNYYTTMQAENLVNKRGLAFPMLRLLTEFPYAFFKDYILRGYIFRGRRGFVNAVMYAYWRFIRVAKYIELKSEEGKR